MQVTPICYVDNIVNNDIYIKRDDLIPYSFGGNKARKGVLFFEEIDKGNYTYVVTYGSSHSNHCRIIANMAAARKIPCIIIGPDEISDATYNSKLMELFGAEIILVPVEDVHDTIDNTLNRLRNQGENPFFILGGGHGNIGTHAYVGCYEEIKKYERTSGMFFDYIFLASGTGTTQAGLVCGQIINRDNRKIVGISIARKNPRGRDVVIESVRDYLCEISCATEEETIQSETFFDDNYTGDGYGAENADIKDTITSTMIKYGIPLDATYTGKAFFGMKQYLADNGVEGKRILFIHTGGTPLFFDEMNSL